MTVAGYSDALIAREPAIARIGLAAPLTLTDPWRRFESALERLLVRANIAA